MGDVLVGGRAGSFSNGARTREQKRPGTFCLARRKKSLFDAGCVQLDPFLIGLSVCTPCVLCIVCLAANITVSLIAKTARGRNPQTRHLQERGRACEACFVECRLEPAVVATLWWFGGA